MNNLELSYIIFNLINFKSNNTEFYWLVACKKLGDLGVFYKSLQILAAVKAKKYYLKTGVKIIFLKSIKLQYQCIYSI